jgi:crossover junction endodeoxyribonuclease RuvC
LGVDPGIAGAAALITKRGGSFHVEVRDIPIHRLGNNNAIDGRAWKAIVQLLKPDVAYFELTWAIPTRARRGENMKGQGVVAAGRTQRAHGVLEGILECELEPGNMIYTIPASWKRRFGLIGGEENKPSSTALALSFFPEAAPRLQRVKDHNRAEAILLAVYGAERQGMLKVQG